MATVCAFCIIFTLALPKTPLMHKSTYHIALPALAWLARTRAQRCLRIIPQGM